MKNIKKTTAILLLCSVTFMTMSSFTLPSQNQLVGSVKAVNLNLKGEAFNSTNGRITPVFILMVVGYALITAASTRETGYSEHTVNQSNTNQNILLNKLG